MMSTLEQTQPALAPTVRPVARSPHWQFGLRTLLLVMAVAGVWLAHFVNCRQIPQLERRILELQQVTRELVVKDPSQLAIVLAEPLWQDDWQWDVYVPGEGFRLMLATDKIEEENYPAPRVVVPLPPGRSRIALDYSNPLDWQIIKIQLNGQQVADELRVFESTHNSGSRRQNDFHSSRQMSPESRPVLYQIWRTDEVEPGVGVKLWIERE